MQYPLFSHEYFMNEALKEAQIAFEKDEIPVGAVIVMDKQIIARGHNLTESLTDVTAHAEIIAMTSAFHFLGSKYIPECSLYVTLEPCGMCATASKWAHLGNLLFGTSDPKAGYGLLSGPVLHPKTRVIGGILEDRCSSILRFFFEGRRK